MKPGSSSTAPVAATAGPSKPVVKPSDPYANYSTAASLGHVDADAERKKVEAERRMKEGEACRKRGRCGTPSSLASASCVARAQLESSRRLASYSITTPGCPRSAALTYID